MTEDKALSGVVITAEDQYRSIIEEGSERILKMTAQLSMNMWSGMGVIYDVCEEAFRILERAGMAGPGRNKDGFVSMGKTYQDLCLKTGLNLSTIKNAHRVFKTTKMIVGGERDDIPTLPLTPKAANMIILHNKLEDSDKERLIVDTISDELSDEQVRARILDITDALQSEHRIYRSTLWSVKRCDPRYGVVYPGRLPGQIIHNTLYHYTEKDDFCLFPFVGGGTEADVAKQMGRDYLAWDINEMDSVKMEHRKKYFVANSLSPWRYREIQDKDADLVFMDPPRFLWGNGKWEDSSSSEAFAHIDSSDIEAFIDSMELLGRHAYDALKLGGKLVLLLRQPGFIDIPKEDITMTIAGILQGNYDLVRRIAVTFPMNMFKPSEPGNFVSGFMDMLVLEKR